MYEESSTKIRTDMLLIYKRYRLQVIVIGLIISLSIIVGILLYLFSGNDSSKQSYNKDIFSENEKDAKTTNKKIEASFPPCPDNLSGILTAPLMDPEYISYLIPLGNVNPPGHTSPVDHIYFDSDYEGRIPLYAPADSWITAVTEDKVQTESGEYETQGYVITYTICEGLVLDITSYKDIGTSIKEEINKMEPTCKLGYIKDGHEGNLGQCMYSDLRIKVNAGEEIGWVQKEGEKFPFEIWAANYNITPRSDVNWDYYKDDRYAHIMCLFDLYEGELKDAYYSKFGGWEPNREPKKKSPLPGGNFIYRTVEPICGEVNQDVVGTIQGMWFTGMGEGNESAETKGGGLAFLHNNIDPSFGEISIGGTITESAGVVYFIPQHTGTVDREPSEVIADGSIYCYPDDNLWGTNGKIVVQLVDVHSMRVEHQLGDCVEREVFNNPTLYER